MKKRLTDDSAPFQRIDDAARLTGLPRGYLRDGAKTGDVPCVWHGRSCLVNVPALLRKLAEDAAGRESSFISLYFGEDVAEGDAQRAGALFEELCPGAEVAVLPGGQPVYYYIISME